VSFNGQDHQDMIAYLYFKGRWEGFYIDIGANDGVSFSNTYVFEQMGWQGICVEPLPDVFTQLKINRNCDCYNVAISDKIEENVKFIKGFGQNTMWSGLDEKMSNIHKSVIKNGKYEYINVKTITFNDLMKDYPDVCFVDFLSIDVEGAEISVLSSIDFKKYQFGLITIENNKEVEGLGNKIINFMRQKDYIVLMDLGLDIMFIPNQNSR
jgi:FkbM family methyltransferase